MINISINNTGFFNALAGKNPYLCPAGPFNGAGYYQGSGKGYLLFWFERLGGSATKGEMARGCGFAKPT